MKRFFLLKKISDSFPRLETAGGQYLKTLWQQIALPAGKYLVVQSPRGAWKFVLSNDDSVPGYEPYDLKHLVHGRWRYIDAPEWCPAEVKSFGLTDGTRFSVRRVK